MRLMAEARAAGLISQINPRNPRLLPGIDHFSLE
jgi:hypothetical protein